MESTKAIAVLRFFEQLADIDRYAIVISREHFLQISGGDTMQLIQLAVNQIEHYENSSNLVFLAVAAEILHGLLVRHGPPIADLDDVLYATAAHFLQWSQESKRLSALEGSIWFFEHAARLRPPGHPECASTLCPLAASLLLRYQLIKAFDSLLDAIRLLKRALPLCPGANPTRKHLLSNLFIAVSAHFNATGTTVSLDCAIRALREGLTLCPDDHQGRLGHLVNLGSALKDRWEKTNEPSSLTECVRISRDAVMMCPTGSASHVFSLHNLGCGLRAQAELLGDLAMLQEAVTYLRAAVKLRPLGNPVRASTMNALGMALFDESQMAGNLERLDESITMHRGALVCCTEGAELHLAILNNLATALCQRYELSSDLFSLEDAIQTHQQALRLVVQGHPRRGTFLYNLSTCLLLLWGHTRDRSALFEAMALRNQTLAESPEEHPNRALMMEGLALALSTVYSVTKEQNVIDRAIHLLRQSVLLYDGNSPRQSQVMHNLALILSNKYRHTLDGGLLDEIIHLDHKAMQLLPGEKACHNRAIIQSGLADALVDRFKVTGDGSELQEAIRLGNDALEALRVGHPERHHVLLSLSTAHLLLSHSHHSIRQSLEHLSSAVTEPFANPRQRLRAGQDWLAKIVGTIGLATNSGEHLRRDVLQVYVALIQLIPRVATFGLNFEGRLLELESLEQLGIEAANYALSMSDPELAVELLEESRAVFWSQALHLRLSLDNLPSSIAARLRTLFRALDAGSHLSGHLDKDTINPNCAWSDGSLVTRRRQSAEAETLIDQVRRMPGLEHFLRPQPFAALSQAASKGPIVILLAVTDTCEAIVLANSWSPAKHILFTGISTKYLVQLGESMRDARLGYRLGTLDNRGIRVSDLKAGQSKDDILTTLWRRVVKPIVDVLGLQVRTFVYVATFTF